MCNKVGRARNIQHTPGTAGGPRRTPPLPAPPKGTPGGGTSRIITRPPWNGKQHGGRSWSPIGQKSWGYVLLTGTSVIIVGCCRVPRWCSSRPDLSLSLCSIVFGQLHIPPLAYLFLYIFPTRIQE
ncbi:hypothetical protein GGR56DRAFT_39215 [Xylariaceae sp. FL0804]|nr:hypothetical protein GGR56DRAFT_39215 [Xylariaceae sp. FL0804]